MQVAFSSTFKKAFRKRIKKDVQLEKRFWRKVELFIENPFERELRTHKLSGTLEGLWSFSVEFDCRVIFYFPEEGKALFIDIGKHDEVY
jgi:addiction module RelE/StbE family toxin